MKVKYGNKYLLLIKKKEWVEWWFDDNTYDVKDIVIRELISEGESVFDIYEMMLGGWPGYLPKGFVADCDHELFDAIAEYQKNHGGIPDENEIYFSKGIQKVNTLNDYYQVTIKIDYK